jgi:DNA-binding transcriptional LysR family regulator
MHLDYAMNLIHLRHILAVAETGSFSRAAEAQAITQPALSRSIAAFEAQHGIRVFDRSRAGVSITPVGRFVVEQARAMLRIESTFERDLKLFSRGAAGRIAFGLGPLVASLVLPALGSDLLSNRPGLEIVALVKPPEQLLPALLDGTIEMILGNSWLISDLSGVEVETIGCLELAVLVRGGHPLAGRPGLARADLESYPVARTVWHDNGEGAAGGLVCDNYHILRDTVMTTDCIWVSPPHFVQKEIEQGQMAALDVVDLAPAASPVCVVTRRNRARSPAADAVIELVGELLTGFGMKQPD